MIAPISESENACGIAYALYLPLHCGTDGKTYIADGSFGCAQNGEYEQRVNLQLKHKGPCWPWQHYGKDIEVFFTIVN